MSNYQNINLNQLSETFKALSNPNRLQIFLRLLNCCAPGTACSTDAINGFCVGELGEELTIAPSTLSHHIKELQRAGLINTQRKGQNVECFIDVDTVKLVRKIFN